MAELIVWTVPASLIEAAAVQGLDEVVGVLRDVDGSTSGRAHVVQELRARGGRGVRLADGRGLPPGYTVAPTGRVVVLGDGSQAEEWRVGV